MLLFDFWQPSKKKYVLAQYLPRCPKIKKDCQRPPFKILVYMEEERRERALLLDSDKEMMDEYEFMSWMAKPKNGSMKAGEAMRLYEVYHAMPGAITDLLGKHKECPRRVAIDTKTLIINRDARIHEHACEHGFLERIRALQTLNNAAKAQGQVTSWREQCKDPAKKNYIVAQYLLCCPTAKESKRQRQPFRLNIRELGAEEDGGNASPAPVSTKNIAFFDRDAAVASAWKAPQLLSAEDRETPGLLPRVQNEVRLMQTLLTAMQLITSSGPSLPHVPATVAKPETAEADAATAANAAASVTCKQCAPRRGCS